MNHPPSAKKADTILEKHNDKRKDPYYWMKKRDSDEVLDHLNAENTYLKQAMKPTESFQEQLFEELKGRIKQTDMSVPYFKNGYWYQTKFEAGKEYPRFTRTENLNTAETEILDVNTEAAESEYYDIASLKVSPDNSVLAFGEDRKGRRIYSVRFKDLRTGHYLKDRLKDTDGYIIWANDSKTLFYTTKDETLRSYKVFRHILGTPQQDDIEIFHERDETFDVHIKKSRSDNFIMIVSEATLSSETYLLNADNPFSPLVSFLPRQKKLEYSVDHFEDQFYILHNCDAVNFQLSKTTVPGSPPPCWNTIVPHRTNALIEEIQIFKNHIVILERLNANVQVRILNMCNGEDHYVAFQDQSYVAHFGTNAESDTSIVRLTYSSLTVPSSVYSYNMDHKELDLLKREEITGDFNPTCYRSEKIFVTAGDGALIPVSMVYHSSTPIDGTAPLLLYGYGAYGINSDPHFSSSRLSLLNRGFIFAIAHIRGGQELGRLWYEEGKLLNKKNTFSDFIDVADHLVKSKYTNTEVLTAMGGSAGGLLIGAVINDRPDLFKAVIAAVPFVDVVTTMLDESIPLTTGEYDEWGDPNVKTYYDYMKSYSPYDNIRKTDYPAILALTGLHDSQVQYWEPAKWVAKLRDCKTDDNLLLLHTNMSTGHGGASGRFERLREIALEYTFLLLCTGKL